MVKVDDGIGNLGGAGLLEQRNIGGGEAHLLSKKVGTDGSLLFELADEMIALVEGLRAWGALSADPELLGPSIRECGLRGPMAIGGHGKGREGLAAVEDNLGPGRGLVGDECLRFPRVCAGEADFFGETVGACGERHLNGLLERAW